MKSPLPVRVPPQTCHVLTNVRTGERCRKPLVLGHLYALDQKFEALCCLDHQNAKKCDCAANGRAA